MESGTSTLNSQTNLTLGIWNTGSVSISLVAYHVTDQSGNSYQNPNWSGPTLQPNVVATISFVIDGQSFTFQHGKSYTVVVTSARNNQFYFTFNIS